MNKIFSNKKLIIFLVATLGLIIFFIWAKILESKIAIRSINTGLTANTLNTISPINTEELTNKIDQAKAIILIYHSVRPMSDTFTKSQRDFNLDPIMFDKQIKYLLDNGYNIIPMSDLLEHYQNNKSLPKNAVIINFDDGWKNQYKYAYPILKKYGISATFFIYTDKISVGHAFMNWDEIIDLQNNRMEIQSHSIDHPILTRINDDEKLFNEIYQSKKILEQKLNKPIKIFAYPYGMYNEKTISVVKNTGYEMARGIYNGRIHKIENRYKETGYLISNNFSDFLKILNK